MSAPTFDKAWHQAEVRRLENLKGSATGKIERIEEDCRITEYDPARAPSASEILKQWRGDRPT